MELVLDNKFGEMSENELENVDGGSVWVTATTLVAAGGAALVGGFSAGRQFVRDVKEKFY